MENIFLSPIPLDQLLSEVRKLVKEELTATQQSVPQKAEAEYLTRKEVAKRLNISLSTLNELTKSGRLKAYRLERRVLYKPAEVDAALSMIKSSKIFQYGNKS